MVKSLKIKVYDLNNKEKEEITLPTFIFSADIK